MTIRHPHCPFCHSSQTLPIEHGEDYEGDESPEVAVYAGITLTSAILGGLILILLVPQLAVVVASGWLAWAWNRKKRRKPLRGPFICLDCSRIFPNPEENAQVK